MKKSLWLIIGLFFLIPALFSQEAPIQRKQGFQYLNTLISPYLKRRIFEGKNILFCSVFQLGWDSLKNELTKGPIELRGNPIANQMLNEELVGREGLSEEYYLAMSGYAQDRITEKVLRELKQKFNESPGIDLDLKRPQHILIYSFLSRNLDFLDEFEDLTQPIKFRGTALVKAFGIKKYAEELHREMAENVEIFDYKNDEHFIIRIRSKFDDDEIILAKFAPKKALFETLGYILEQIEKKVSAPLREGDTLQIPKLDFDIVDRFIEIEGRNLANRGLEDYFLDKAVQSVRLILGGKAPIEELEESAFEELDAGIKKKGNGLLKPRKLVFNDRFLICLKEQNARYPYLVIWVDNPELLLKTE